MQCWQIIRVANKIVIKYWFVLKIMTTGSCKERVSLKVTTRLLTVNPPKTMRESVRCPLPNFGTCPRYSTAQVILGLSGWFYLRKCSKIKIFMGPKWSKNVCRSSLESKEAHKNHFWAILVKILVLEKKVSEIPLKCKKMPSFWNFKCGFLDDIGR